MRTKRIRWTPRDGEIEIDGTRGGRHVATLQPRYGGWMVYVRGYSEWARDIKTAKRYARLALAEGGVR